MAKKEMVDDSSAFSVADVWGNQNVGFFLLKLHTSPNVLTPADAFFQTPENIRECGLKKKLLKIKIIICPRVYLILARDTR